MAKDALIGQQFDEYRLDKLLGRGGMARVYRGFDVRLKRWVAIKVIDTPFQANSEYIKRFEREAQAIAQLEHPNIVSIYRYGEVDTVLYIAMRFIEGSPLDALLRVYRADQDFIPFAEAEQLIQQICRALDYAHSRGVIHRDIKPANILIDREGNAVLSDFGLALLTSEGTRGEIFGTPHYIAPEQAMSSADVVPQSDLYAVGVIMYEMFTGQVPFTAQEPLDVALLHMTESPPPPRAVRPELSPALEAVILKALAKKPADRYPNGRALGQALRQALRLQRDATTQLAAPRLSILERVALDLANRPLPPPPGGASSPKLANGSAGQQHDTQRTSVSPMRVPAALPAKKVSPLILAGIGAGLVLVLGAVLALVGFLTFRTNASDDRSLQAGEVTSPPAGTSLPSAASLDTGGTPTADPVQPVEATASPAAQPGTTESTGSVEGPVVVILTPEAVPATSTLAPSSTPTLPPPSPTPTPLPQPVPELVADTWTAQEDWEYLTSPLWRADWNRMQFRNGQFGACWYGQEEYIRICSDKAHPGQNADIAWLWTSQISGPLEVKVYAAKEAAGGDGLLLYAYLNDVGRREARVFEKYLGEGNTGGFTDSFRIEQIELGDYLLFSLHMNETPISDATKIRLQICRHSCPDS